MRVYILVSYYLDQIEMPVFLLANSPFCSLSSTTHGTGPSELGAGVPIALPDFGLSGSQTFSVKKPWITFLIPPSYFELSYGPVVRSPLLAAFSVGCSCYLIAEEGTQKVTLKMEFQFFILIKTFLSLFWRTKSGKHVTWPCCIYRILNLFSSSL